VVKNINVDLMNEVKLEARESFYQGNRLVVRTRVSMFERGHMTFKLRVVAFARQSLRLTWRPSMPDKFCTPKP
jgi:hypothetical protein